MIFSLAFVALLLPWSLAGSLLFSCPAFSWGDMASGTWQKTNIRANLTTILQPSSLSIKRATCYNWSYGYSLMDIWFAEQVVHPLQQSAITAEPHQPGQLRWNDSTYHWDLINLILNLASIACLFIQDSEDLGIGLKAWAAGPMLRYIDRADDGNWRHLPCS